MVEYHFQEMPISTMSQIATGEPQGSVRGTFKKKTSADIEKLIHCHWRNIALTAIVYFKLIPYVGISVEI